MPSRLHVHLGPGSVFLWLAAERLDRICLHPDPHSPVNVDSVRLLLGDLTRTSHVHSERKKYIVSR